VWDLRGNREVGDNVKPLLGLKKCSRAPGGHNVNGQCEWQLIAGVLRTALGIHIFSGRLNLPFGAQHCSDFVSSDLHIDESTTRAPT